MCKYSFETVIIFDFPKDINKDSCTFNYYFNNTSIKPVVLDASDEIILAKWLSKKYLDYTRNNDISIKIPNYFSILVDRSMLYNCDLEAEESFLLDSQQLAPILKISLKCILKFNLAFLYYFDNWTDSIIPTTDLGIAEEQTIPIALQDITPYT